MRTRLWLVRLIVAATLLLTSFAFGIRPLRAATPVVINEFSASTTGTDVEYVEIFGDPGTDYAAYTILEIEGDSGTSLGFIDEVIAVGTTDAAGFFLASLPANALENGTITLLLIEGFTGALGNDLDTNDDGILDVTPWTAIVDAVAVYDGDSGDLTYGAPALGPNYDGVSSFAPGGASRIPDGLDTDAPSDWVRNDFDLAGIPGFEGTPIVGEAHNTPGASNEIVAPEAPGPVINEFSASTTGTDVEYVEIYGDPGTDYTTYTVLEIEGDGTGAGVIDEVISIGTTDAAGFYLADLPANALENGTITLLLVEGFTGSVGTDLDTDNDGILEVTPWAAIVDAVAVSDGGTGDLTYGVPALGPNYDGVSSFAPGGASRIPDGLDTDAPSDWVRNDFDLAGIPGFEGTPIVGEALNTPGAANAIYVPPPEACGDPYTFIYDVQGSGLASPVEGANVAIEGVVVGDFQNNAESDNGDLNGFHVQDPFGDGSSATSDGVFVYAPGGMDVSVGDAVRVRGNVSEFNGMTEVTAAQIWVCSNDNSLPAPAELTLPVAAIDDFEPYEGMLVTFPQDLVISEYFNFDRYGEIVLTTDRQIQPTAIYEPGSVEQATLAISHTLSRITLDDGRTSQNPDPAIHPNGEVFDLNNLFRGGDTVANVTGVLDYSFGLYRVQPTQGADYTETNPRATEPEDVGGNLKVASFNVLNYFTTLDSRGADTDEEFTRQRDKIFAALEAIDADVVGLIEIENNSAAVADLVAGLNDRVGSDVYAHIDTGVVGVDEITVAFIYKPATVSLAGTHAVLEDPAFTNPLGYTDDSYTLVQLSRPALAQTFMDTETGGVFTVVVNHLKSKGSACGEGDDDPVQGNCNLTRALGAQALLDWLATDPTGSGDADFLIIGDLNAYDKEDPIDALVEGGYADLIHQFQGEFAYSYLFNGQLGYLDHSLASPDLLDEVTGTTVWHINADEPDLIDYDMTFKQDAQDAIYAPDAYRASDHDPVIVGLDVCDEIPPELTVTVDPDTLWPVNHKLVPVIATVRATDNFDPAPAFTLLSVTSNQPDDNKGDGNTDDDIVILNDLVIFLRAERDPRAGDRVYTLTYQATDACGNATITTATVTVPRSRQVARPLRPTALHQDVRPRAAAALGRCGDTQDGALFISCTAGVPAVD